LDGRDNVELVSLGIVIKVIVVLSRRIGAAGSACIAYQNIYLPEFGESSVHKTIHRCVIAYIGLQRIRDTTVAQDFDDDDVDTLFVAPVNSDYCPSAANRCAVAAPIPLLAPVTSTRLFFRPKSIIITSFILRSLLLTHCGE
jgi:hypothetical protein